MTLPTLTLNDGFTIPALGFGTYPLVGAEGAAAVRSALDTGYRLLDSAVNYENEGVVGRAARDWLVESGSGRDELTVQTKLPGRHHDYERALASGYESVARLGLDRIDVLMIHWPNPVTGRYREAWRALVELRERGVVRSVGVSNFTPRLLEEIIDDSGVVPVVNQVELHPYFPQEELLEVHARHGIVTEAWSPLGKRQAPYGEPVIVAAAARLGVTPAQVILRWHLERGTVPLPKSATPSRQAENLAVDSFALLPEEVAAITALGREDGRLFDGDPERHEEM
ncbi:aldo/keto reductase [Demequina lignilytica]|uniref:Aldo/keto reductase n=1 Tax=Demequina lignilytica TaxID=3051663 RepID=A0AAW7M532_9MICO|nr:MULTISPECIES: aldo/keto reductase [unclassified Demequina]MDN4478672.1 aldo/keto reductase [Demequina sp. SYSU T00039-1]MDN4483808.1 aldo/keto reductase [Demequina sp. SYSU T0a273]MDN4488650.1 aldo/keto reductase [Demequina sp. SYSU T00039]